MLGNNADAFFTTPMRHTLVRGGNVGNQAPMPSPREANSSATGVVTTHLCGDMLPGLGDAAAPAMEPGAQYNQNAILAALLSPVGLSVIAGVLLLTPIGKGIRRAVGLG